MRLTNRGRIACGVAVTVAALAGQSVYSALAGSDERAPSAPSATSTRSAASPQPRAVPDASVTSGPAAPSASAAPGDPPTGPGAVMDRSRDDLPPVAESTTPTTPTPTTSTPASSTPAADAVPGGTGQLRTVPGASAVAGSGALRRYRVQLEGGTGENGAAFAAAVQRTLSDKRSWGAQWSFQRVDSGPVNFTVVLATPALAERLCKPLEIQYRLSCFSGGRSVINLARWRNGVPDYAGRLGPYRQYVINHEVGHALGHDHEPCHGAGQLAPVMMQQTKGVGACKPNPWPYPGA